MTRKIYIAGKITGDENYRAKFEVETSLLENYGHAVMNPAVMREGFDYEDYMDVCFAMIDVCDTVYFLNDWKESPGAMREHDRAKRKGKWIVYQGDLTNGEVRDYAF